MGFRDQVVVVTGASSGIGWVTARAFAERGAVVVAVARRQDRLKRWLELCRESSPRSEYLAGDLGVRAFAEQVIDEAATRHGRIDVLVNNAAIPKHKRIYHTSAEEAERVMQVNFLSYVWTSFAAIPYMLRDGGGTIVNVSSFAGRIVPPREALYAASKAAVNAFTEGLWNELEGSKIHVALVIPGAIDTEIWDKLEEASAFRGRKTPPEVVTDAIFEAIEKRRRQIVVPRCKLDLAAASLLRLVAPGLLRLGMRRMDPVPGEVIERARGRARRGERLGDPADDRASAPPGAG